MSDALRDDELLIDDPTVDTPVKVDAPAGKAEERKPDAKTPDVDQGIAALRNQLKQATQRAEANEQALRRAAVEVDQARAYAGNTQFQAISGALEQRKERLASLKEELKNATAVGDGDRVADLTEAMADVKIDMRQLEEGKRHLEARLQQQPERQPERQSQRQQAADADDGLSAEAREWISRHPESVTDPKANARMMAGHWSALGQGIEADTPEYFAHLDKVYGGKAAEPERGRVADEPTAPERPQARYAAAPERDSGPRKVQLRITPEMREAAAMADMSIEEYAKEYVKLHGVR